MYVRGFLFLRFHSLLSNYLITIMDFKSTLVLSKILWTYAKIYDFFHLSICSTWVYVSPHPTTKLHVHTYNWIIPNVFVLCVAWRLACPTTMIQCLMCPSHHYIYSSLMDPSPFTSATLFLLMSLLTPRSPRNFLPSLASTSFFYPLLYSGPLYGSTSTGASQLVLSTSRCLSYNTLLRCARCMDPPQGSEMHHRRGQTLCLPKSSRTSIFIVWDPSILTTLPCVPIIFGWPSFPTIYALHSHPRRWSIIGHFGGGVWLLWTLHIK